MNSPTFSLDAALRRNAQRRGHRAALWIPGGDRPPSTLSDVESGGCVVSWSILDRWVAQLALDLRDRLASSSRRPSDGDTCGWLVHTTDQTFRDVLIALACQAAGIVECPIDLSGGAAYIAACRSQLEAVSLDGGERVAMIDRAAARAAAGATVPRPDSFASPTDDALVLWTSGTSGRPKGVVLSVGALALNAAAKLQAVPQAVSDTRLTVLSFAHAYARTCDLGTWLLSGCQLAVTRGFDGWCRSAGLIEPTLCNTVPSLAERMLDSELGLNRLRLLGCGGAALPPDAFQAWKQRGVTVIQGYGLTECGPVISSQTPSDSVPERVGQVVTGWESELRGDRLFVRGACTMNRYLEDPASTRQRIDPDGWLDTGDLVRQCEQTGQLQILGRADDRINLSNGFNVDPSAIEQRFQSLPGVATALVVGSANGRGIDLWIERDPDAEPAAGLEASLDTVAETLAAWERPKRVGWFQLPATQRPEMVNRKGAVRRAALMAYVRDLPIE
ncbi:acyl--CoA ligase [Roseiconus nitratireducens]|uniref:Acyl--CoA ligase n=1 Tax=Roseiconus nitratireducens TaxID=2605748 RepID=A0A5M6DHX1_9BACT|nr:class I adenylate-forming enzyme family protein [Roseiconus nitratireducens]KAA5545966.1 acyl--CoA ligase [Roseiconus nitratireducens]